MKAKVSARNKNPLFSEAEKQLIQRARIEKNPNILTEYFFRSEGTGTYYRAVLKETLASLRLPEFKEYALNKAQLYQDIFAGWSSVGQPEYFGISAAHWLAVPAEEWERRNTSNYADVYYHAYADEHKRPVFHHWHGLRTVPWGLKLWEENKSIALIIGGYGSSKSVTAVLKVLSNALMYESYAAMIMAPSTKQVGELWDLVMMHMTPDTRYRDMIVHEVKVPYPRLTIASPLGRRSIIDFIPLDATKQQDSSKLLSLTRDEVVIDQVEQYYENLGDILSDIGTRMRGTVVGVGRQRLKKMLLLANSVDNPFIMDMADDPGPDTLYMQIGTHENPYLSVEDLVQFERTAGRTEAEARQKLFGSAPIIAGALFSADMVDNLRYPTFDNMMQEGIAAGKNGYKFESVPKAGVITWQIPPEVFGKSSRYLVCADPGTANPPERGSPPVMVWNIDNFPQSPARLVAFHWVYGAGNTQPWINKFREMTVLYNAIGDCFYDGTGTGAGYVYEPMLEDIGATPVIFNENMKHQLITMTQVLLNRELLKAPFIPRFYYQIQRYKLPDKKLAQDIFMTLLVAVYVLRDLYISAFQGEYEEIEENSYDRYKRRSENRNFRGIPR